MNDRASTDELPPEVARRPGVFMPPARPHPQTEPALKTPMRPIHGRPRIVRSCDDVEAL
jgi:hypothetical protein